MPKGGRPKGSQNRTTIQIKTALLKALDRLGGVDYLVKVGEENPAVFCALLAKIIPTELKATVNELPVVRVFSGAPQAQVIESEVKGDEG
jgi:hypothetical protein